MDAQTKLTSLVSVFNLDSHLVDQLKEHRLVVVIPAYNEERFIGSVVLKALQFPLTVIVVDDGSTDATAFIAEIAGASVIRHDLNLGKGVALNSGISEARKLDPEVVVVIDGDGQHLVRELPRLVAPILGDKADIVIGSRYLQNTSNTPVHRRLGHLFFNFATNLASQVPATDSQSGYRAFSPRAFNADLFLSTDFTVESEMQFFAHEHGLRVVEVPITIRYTDPPKRSAISQGRMVLNGILHLVGQYRPLLFFGVPGSVSLAIGIFFGIWVVDIYSRIQTLAVGYAMISVLMSMIGMVLLSTGFTLHSIRGLLTDMLHSNGNHPVRFF
jgi:glycosyltransferase involved in cell wall biosynthesis